MSGTPLLVVLKWIFGGFSDCLGKIENSRDIDWEFCLGIDNKENLDLERAPAEEIVNYFERNLTLTKP